MATTQLRRMHVDKLLDLACWFEKRGLVFDAQYFFEEALKWDS